MITSKCLHKGCEGWVRADGYCRKHSGDKPSKMWCEVRGCDKPRTARSSCLCSLHKGRAKNYGLDHVTYVALMAQTECEACGREAPLVIDHDHSCCPAIPTCGECFRGMLCSQCNVALGMVQDSADRLAALIGYLNR